MWKNNSNNNNNNNKTRTIGNPLIIPLLVNYLDISHINIMVLLQQTSIQVHTNITSTTIPLVKECIFEKRDFLIFI